jgi:hypothetical protein
MTANQGTSTPVPKPNMRTDYHPLWRHVTKNARTPGCGSQEWQCNHCNNTYKSSYPRVKTHFLQESGRVVDCCPKTNNPTEKRKYESEQKG